jgi:four helix bundle protein
MELQAHQNFTDLEVWQRGRELKKEIEALPKTFPADEKYRMTDQIIRSVRSINSNIAEGHGRFSYKDQLHFCIQARGSLSETLNHLIDAYDCNYITKEQLAHFKIKTDEVGKLLNGYITYLRKKLQE